MKTKKIYVYYDNNYDVSILMGVLYCDEIHGKEIISFEYSEMFLKSKFSKFIFDPEIERFKGRQYLNSDKEIFGFLSDLCPDRWGRVLLNRKESILAKKEKRRPNKLLESDYLLGVYDNSRMGAIRLKLEEDGDYVSSDDDMNIPSWIYLRKLESMAYKIDNDEKIEEGWLKNLVIPGSSLGGARPKANVLSTDNELWIAKFPSKSDDYDVGAWEKVVSDLAYMCGLNVPESKLEKYSEYGSTFLVKRFDRIKDKRIHYTSAMTFLNAIDGKSNDYSYVNIAEIIKSHGARPKEDLLELWKRLVFNMAISNTDDHLRNHGFILTNDGWRLSPLFDVNPCPYGTNLSLNINEYDSEINIESAIIISSLFGISEREAQEISSKMINIINSNWRKLANKYCISNSEINRMESAFRIK